MQLNDTKKQFNFLKSLDIADINSKVEILHPSAHEFWENVNVKKEFMDYLKDFSRNKKTYDKQTVHEVDATTSNYMRGDYE